MVSPGVQPLLLAVCLLAAGAQAEDARQAFGALLGRMGNGMMGEGDGVMTIRDPKICWRGFHINHGKATIFKAVSWEACRQMCREREEQHCELFSFKLPEAGQALGATGTCHLVSFLMATKDLIQAGEQLFKEKVSDVKENMSDNNLSKIAMQRTSPDEREDVAKEHVRQTDDPSCVSGWRSCEELVKSECTTDATDEQCIARLQIGKTSSEGLRQLTQARPELFGALEGCEKGVARLSSSSGTWQGSPFGHDSVFLLGLFTQLKVVKKSNLLDQIGRDWKLMGKNMARSMIEAFKSRLDHHNRNITDPAKYKAEIAAQESTAQIQMEAHMVQSAKTDFDKTAAGMKDGTSPLYACDTRRGADDGRVVIIGSQYAFMQDRDFKMQRADVHVDTVTREVKLYPFGFFSEAIVAFPIKGVEGKANVFEILTDKFPKGLKPIIQDHVALIRKLP